MNSFRAGRDYPGGIPMEKPGGISVPLEKDLHP